MTQLTYLLYCILVVGLFCPAKRAVFFFSFSELQKWKLSVGSRSIRVGRGLHCRRQNENKTDKDGFSQKKKRYRVATRNFQKLMHPDQVLSNASQTINCQSFLMHSTHSMLIPHHRQIVCYYIQFPTANALEHLLLAGESASNTYIAHAERQTDITRTNTHTNQNSHLRTMPKWFPLRSPRLRLFSQNLNTKKPKGHVQWHQRTNTP